MLFALSLAFSSPNVQIPVQGEIAGGSSPTGAVSTRVVLSRDAAATDVVHDETQIVTYDAGRFSLLLGTSTALDAVTLATPSPLWLTFTVGSDAPSAAVALGWSARAAWAARAAEANHATDADTVGGLAPTTFQTVANAWTPGSGLTLSGRTFSVSPTQFALSNQSCTAGQVVTGISASGVPVCATDANNTYTGANFALSNQSCTTGQVVRGISSTGVPLCVADANDTYTGANFALSNQSCSAGQVITGITAAGAAVCATDANNSYSGSNFALSNQTCSAGQVMTGISSTGTPVCTTAGGSTPVGTIVAWHKNLTNTPALPSGWLECNGQTVSDAASVYNGVALPNLNGGNRFLRGSGGTSGALGGSATHTHTFGQTSTDLAPDASNVANGSFTNAADHQPPYMDIVWIIRVK